MAPRLKKPSACAICRHPERRKIEALRIGGASLSAVARRFGLTGKDVVHRHFKLHVSPARRADLMLGPAQFESLATHAAAESRTLLERVDIATSLLFKRFVACAEAEDDYRLAIIAGRLNVLFREYAGLTGELRQLSGLTINNTVLNVNADPSYPALEEGLLELAQRHPAARDDVLALLARLEASYSPGPNGAPYTMIEGEGVREGEIAMVADVA
jgi:hypothetical protein